MLAPAWRWKVGILQYTATLRSIEVSQADTCSDAILKGVGSGQWDTSRDGRGSCTRAQPYTPAAERYQPHRRRNALGLAMQKG